MARDGLQEASSTLAATQRGEGVYASMSVLINRASRSLAFLATVVPNRALMANPSAGEACCLVFVDDFSREKTPRHARMQQLCGLTSAEARVAGFLATGLSPREIADELQVSFNTVRTHLRRIFPKTDTSRQGELIRLLSRLGLTIPDRMQGVKV